MRRARLPASFPSAHSRSASTQPGSSCRLGTASPFWPGRGCCVPCGRGWGLGRRSPLMSSPFMSRAHEPCGQLSAGTRASAFPGSEGDGRCHGRSGTALVGDQAMGTGCCPPWGFRTELLCASPPCVPPALHFLRPRPGGVHCLQHLFHDISVLWA